MKCRRCNGRKWIEWSSPNNARQEHVECPKCKGSGNEPDLLPVPVRPGYSCPCEYAHSVVEFDLACDCHPGRFVGKAKRTGLRTDGAVDRPVYFLYTVAPHEELRDQLAMLAPEGLLLLGKSLVGGYRD